MLCNIYICRRTNNKENNTHTHTHTHTHNVGLRMVAIYICLYVIHILYLVHAMVLLNKTGIDLFSIISIYYYFVSFFKHFYSPSWIQFAENKGEKGEKLFCVFNLAILLIFHTIYNVIESTKTEIMLINVY